MKTLTKSEATKIAKAKELISKAIELLNSVNSTNQEFKYDGNTNSLFNRLQGAKDIIEEL